MRHKRDARGRYAGSTAGPSTTFGGIFKSMSQRALNTSLFHGTSASLGPGDKVLPPAVAKAGTPNSSYVRGRYGDLDPYHNASASASEKTAWEFAGMTAQRVGGRAQVLKVQTDDLRKGVEPKEFISKQFDVTDVEHIRPPESVRKPGKHMRYHPNPNGRQGTLPIDWTPPGRHNSGSMSAYAAEHGDNYNHPTQRARDFEAKRTAQQEADRQPEERPAPKPRQAMLPGMRGMGKKRA